MPQCINCKVVLPSMFFGKSNPNDPRCEFCVRDTTVLRYLEGVEEKTYTKGQCEQDYKEFLRLMTEKPNIRNIIDQSKMQEEKFEENFSGIASEDGDVVDYKP